MANSQSNFITAKEIANWLNISLLTVYKKSRTNELPHIRLGRLIRINRKEIEQFIAKGGMKSNNYSDSKNVLVGLETLFTILRCLSLIRHLA